MTTLTASLLLHFRPFEDPLMNRLEVFNEMTNLFSFAFAYVLTDLPLNGANTLNDIHEVGGHFFLALIFGNISVHLFFLFKSLLLSCKLYCKYRLIPRMKQKNTTIEIKDTTI